MHCWCCAYISLTKTQNSTAQRCPRVIINVSQSSLALTHVETEMNGNRSIDSAFGEFWLQLRHNEVVHEENYWTIIDNCCVVACVVALNRFSIISPLFEFLFYPRNVIFGATCVGTFLHLHFSVAQTRLRDFWCWFSDSSWSLWSEKIDNTKESQESRAKNWSKIFIAIFSHNASEKFPIKFNFFYCNWWARTTLNDAEKWSSPSCKKIRKRKRWRWNLIYDRKWNEMSSGKRASSMLISFTFPSQAQLIDYFTNRAHQTTRLARLKKNFSRFFRAIL